MKPRKKPRKGSIAYEVQRLSPVVRPLMYLAQVAVRSNVTLPELRRLLTSAYRGALKADDFVYHDEQHRE